MPLYPDDAVADPNPQAARGFPGLEWAQDPSWSPNGDRVAFSGQPRGQPDQRGIYWLTLPAVPAAREVREVAQQPQPEIQPDWQPTADLAIVLSAAPATVQLGSGSVLTATVTNEGPAAAIAAVATMTLPAGLAVGTLPGTCVAGPPITCSLGTLANRATATIALPVTGTALGSHTATASTSSRSVDPDPLDNTARTVVGVDPIPTPETPTPQTPTPVMPTPVPPVTDVGVSLAVTPSPGYVGGASTLTVTLTNAGPLLAAVRLAVTMPAEAGPADDEPCLTEAGCDLGSVPPGVPLVKTFALKPQAAVDGTAKGTVALVPTAPVVPPDPEAPMRAGGDGSEPRPTTRPRSRS